MESKTDAKSLFAFTSNLIDGKSVNLSDVCKHKKCTLIVNVARKCGHTKRHYTELVQMYAELEPKGFQILAFPCNQFGY